MSVQQSSAKPSASESQADVRRADGSAPPCTVSPLHAADVDEWLDHLAVSFAHKGTLRSYFQRHLLHDPHLDHAGIVVLHTPQQRCVSSIRVFKRAIYVGGEQVLCGGIGEVSTQVEWRGKGFAALCLQRGAEYMQSVGMSLSSLHTSNAASYYQQLGWQPVERVHGLLSVDRIPTAGAADSKGVYGIQQLTARELTSSPLLPSIMATYSEYARRFDGPVVRTAEYWQRWVHAEHEAAAATPSPVLILVATSAAASEQSAVCGYAFLQHVDKPITVEATAADSSSLSSTTTVSTRLLVREFACSAHEVDVDGGRSVFLALLRHAVRSLHASPASPVSHALHVQYALPIALSFRPPLDSEYEHVDSGFMYRPIEPASAAQQQAQSSDELRDVRTVCKEWLPLSHRDGKQLLATLQADGRHKHVFFATDAF